VLLSRVVPTYEIKPNTAVLRDLVVVGHLVAMGALAYLVTALWRRYAPRRPIFAYVGLTVVTIGLAAPALYEDLSIAAGKIGLPSNVSRVLLIVAVSLVVPIAALFGRLVSRPWLHAVGLIAAIGLGVANHLVFPEDYIGGASRGGAGRGDDVWCGACDARCKGEVVEQDCLRCACSARGGVDRGSAEQ
jgi:hypothetical protein